MSKALTNKEKLDQQTKVFIARGKIKMIDELFDELSDEQKEDCIMTMTDRNHTVDEWWKGMTITGKKKALINLITEPND